MTETHDTVDWDVRVKKLPNGPTRKFLLVPAGDERVPHKDDCTQIALELARKAERNVSKWGLQDLTTLCLAIAEETGELAQAILQYEHEGGEFSRIAEEAADLGALCVQVLLYVRNCFNFYKCNHCGKVVRRESTKRWIPSWCEETGQYVRLWRVDDMQGSRDGNTQDE